jgi:hypothetical protein
VTCVVSPADERPDLALVRVADPVSVLLDPRGCARATSGAAVPVVAAVGR